MAADGSITSSLRARRFRPEIQGLRTLAAGLVGIYHIWFDRVSGGVDVFFVVSGFLITGSILGSLDRTGSIRFGAHLGRVARRILPAAYVVLAISMVLTVVLISKVFWEETFREVVAAALYVANWQFASSSVDYLANDEFQSPVLQFWALSVQGQFYVVWPLVLLVAGMIARRRGVSLRASAIGVISVLVIVSFTYSVERTAGNQVTAYYDSAARIWEFGLGGLTALLFASTVVPVWAARVLSAIGLGMILGTGLLLDVSGSFPGWPALIPTGGAVLVLLAGTNERTVGGLRFLRWRPVVALGDISYAFFLWQWTLLSFTKLHFDLERFTFLQGLGVMAAAIVAAVITHRLVEQPFLARRDAAPTRSSLIEVGAGVALIAALVSASVMLVPRETTVSSDDMLASGVLPEMLASADATTSTSTTTSTSVVVTSEPPSEQRPSVLPAPVPVADDLFVPGSGPLVPDPATARRDRPAVYDDGCHQSQDDSDVILCRYGTIGGQPVALVGGSHIAQWQPAFDLLGQRHGWEVWMVTRSACRLEASPAATDSCLDWVDNAQSLLLDELPDTVIVLGTTGSSPGERIVDGAPPLWQELADAGIDVIAMRDNPRFGVNPPECVLEHGADAAMCGRPRAEALAAVNPLLEDPVLDHLRLVIDLSPWHCADEFCPVVAGDILMYRDRHHHTVAYVLALAPVLERMLVPVLGSTVAG